MSKIPESCVLQSGNMGMFVASEKGKKYELINESKFHIRKIRVDNCLPNLHGSKQCDFLFSIDHDISKQLPFLGKQVIFIELKGGDLKSAVRQLYTTILHLREEFDGYRINARIVGSRDVPDLKNTSDYLKLARLVKQFSGNVDRSTNKFYSETV